MPTSQMSSTVNMFGIAINKVSMAQAVEDTLSLALSGHRDCHYVVTPNVDHVVQLQDNEAFRAAYGGAKAIYADGKPLILASALLGNRLPGVVPGSDLVPGVLAEASRARRTLTVYLLGAPPGVAERAAVNIGAQWGPKVQVVGIYSPPMGFEHDAVECRRIIDRVNAVAPDLLVLGLGAPKQELWVHRHQAELKVGVALCVGATIDFLAGNKRRAPQWMRTLAVEWVYRMLQEPRRMIRRYAHDMLMFPLLLARELTKR